MEGMNKFKVLTVIVVFLFIFAVSAMYTNTKEASRDKARQNAQVEGVQQPQEEESDFAPARTTVSDSQISELNDKIDTLSARVDSVEASTSMTCRVFGVRTDNGIEQLSASSAVSEARDNGEELVLSCSFK
jgi:uncharacterized protein YlxW (UPF0749 family)